jgi:hypothetical protein
VALAGSGRLTGRAPAGAAGVTRAVGAATAGWAAGTTTVPPRTTTAAIARATNEPGLARRRRVTEIAGTTGNLLIAWLSYQPKTLAIFTLKVVDTFEILSTYTRRGIYRSGSTLSRPWTGLTESE